MASRPVRTCRANDSASGKNDWGEEEECFAAKRVSSALKKTRKVSASPSKKSQRPASVTNYCEASSEDEFAKEHFLLESCDEYDDKQPNSNKMVSCSAKSADDDIEYRIQHILGKKSMPQSEWRAMNENYTTIEVTKGSVWQQPDEEYFDDSTVPLEKFLIKWAHASYLHVSWETEKDLLDMVGLSAKQHIKKFRLREFEGRDLFDDLSKVEFFPPSFSQIERILDVDDPEVDMFQVDWEAACLPENMSKSKTYLNSENIEKVNAMADKNSKVPLLKDNDDEDVIVRRSSRKSGKRSTFFDDSEDDEILKVETKTFAKSGRSKKQKLSCFIHGGNCWVTVKWEGLPYSDVSFESLNDLISRGVEYESQLRSFYRREQRCLLQISSNKKVNRKLVLDQTIIGSNSSPPIFPGGILRDYQWEGVRWMLFNLMQGRNCILADEMGLGKTIQSSTLLHMVKMHQASSGPFLVVAPLSTIVNWQREISSWTNLDSILYYGSQDDRELIRSYEFKFLNSSSDNKSKVNNGYKIEVVITTPETCVAYDDKSGAKRELSRIPWDIIIVDEAHKLKNYDSKLSSTLRDDYTFKSCVLLTGTPLQNNTDELWTLLNFVANEDFSDREEFIQNFGELKSSSQLDSLHKRIKPYLLRREKEHVEKGVPPKEEIIIEVELTVPQKQYYRAIYEQKTGFLYKAGTKDGPSLSNLAMELRKCCNHPFLIKGATNEISNHFVHDSPNDVLVKSSGKMTLLDKLLPKLQKDGHRVLIFSQFRMMLDLIEDYLHWMGYMYERVDGSVVGKKRQAAIDRYTQNENIFVMLLSTKAGGVGINLTAADTVIIYDSDWNPQNDIQAQARAHRIGQTRSVTVYRLLTKKTYEMVMFRAASIKLGLDYAVMHNLDSTVDIQQRDRKGARKKGNTIAALQGISSEKAEHVSSLSKKELETLLKHGAYDMFIEEKEGISEKESSKFVEESIEQILERSSVFVHKNDEIPDSADSDSSPKQECVHEAGDAISTKSIKVSKTCSFAKASFVSASDSGEDNEVAIDDPDFWNKVIGLAVEEEDTGVGSKRKCRQLVDSYKEPTDSIRSIYGSMQNAYASDSDDSAASGSSTTQGKKKRRKKDEIVQAEYTSDNILSVLNAVIALGFTNWLQIKKVSKLRWEIPDLKRAAKLGIIYLLLVSSLSIGEECGENCETHGDRIYDIGFFHQAIRKYKLSKLILHALLQHDVGDMKISSLDNEDEDLLLTSALGNMISPFSADNSQTITNHHYKECFDKAFLPSQFDGSVEEKSEDIKACLNALNNLPEIQLLKSCEFDCDKSQKRVTTYRNKLAQIEDLYEAFVFCKVLTMMNPQKYMDECFPKVSNESPSAAMLIGECGGNSDPADERVVDVLGPATEMSFSMPNTFFPAGLQNLITESGNEKEKIPNWWNLSYDCALLHAIVLNGWPEGKRRLSGVNGILTQLSPADGSDTNMAEMLTAKFVMQRFKILTKALRYAEEDVAAQAKAIATAKATAKAQMKKNISQILKLVQRNGYPRSCYPTIVATLLETIRNVQEQVVRISYLYSWENLAAECNMDGNEGEVKNIVFAALEFLNNEAENFTSETIISGLLEDVNVKLVKAAFEKSDIIHHIRLTLAMNSESDIKNHIIENCKGTGPSIPGYKRDMTMPVWWTLDHDISLLKLCLTHGYGAWKPITVDPAISTAPDDFVMPPKVNGVEWLIQLTPRNAEKRVLALLRGMPQIKTLQLTVPSSPQKKGPGIQQVAPLPSVNKGIFWFQQKSILFPPKQKENEPSVQTTVITDGNAHHEMILNVGTCEIIKDAPTDIATSEKGSEMLSDLQHIRRDEFQVNVTFETSGGCMSNVSPVNTIAGENYVDCMNSIRDESPVNLIVIDDEDALNNGQYCSETKACSSLSVDKSISTDCNSSNHSAEVHASPTKDITKIRPNDNSTNTNNMHQTPQALAINSAPEIEKKSRKKDKISLKVSAVSSTKSILSFFKKV